MRRQMILEHSHSFFYLRILESGQTRLTQLTLDFSSQTQSVPSRTAARPSVLSSTLPTVASVVQGLEQSLDVFEVSLEQEP
jgi:hypothetical protein